MATEYKRSIEPSVDSVVGQEPMVLASLRMARAIDAQRGMASLISMADESCGTETIAEMIHSMTDRIEAAFRPFDDYVFHATAGERQTLMPDQQVALEWMANGETGVSSKTLVFRVMFDIRLNDGSHPYDLADLNRCIKALNAIPAMRPNLYKMADMSLTWKRLVSSWGVLEKSFINEAGIDWSRSRQAPITHDLMQRVFAGELLADSPSGQPGNAC